MCSALIWATGTLNHISCRGLSQPEQFCYSTGDDLCMCTADFCCFFLSFMFGFFLHFISVSSSAGYRGSKTITILVLVYMRRIVSYFQGFYVICEEKDILRK